MKFHTTPQSREKRSGLLPYTETVWANLGLNCGQWRTDKMTRPSTLTSSELLTVEELAARLKVKPSWVYGRTRKRGAEGLPHLKLGKYLRFEEGAVREFLERQKVSVRNS